MATPDRKLFPAGSLLGELRVIRVLGRGNNGDTYLVREQAKGNLVVLKALHADRFQSKQQNAALVDALKALSANRHPNAVAVLGAGDMGERPYYLLEYVDGETLRQRMRVGTFALYDVQRIAAGISAALADSHKRTVFHHELKPDNVLLGKDGTVKVHDLGVARLLKKALSPTPTNVTAPLPADLEYMAPEQVRGDAAAGAADNWALGAMIFEMLSGAPPYQGRIQQVLADQISNADRVRRLPNSAKNVPPELSELLYKLLEKAGAQRPQSSEVADALRKLAALPAPVQESTPFRGLFPFTEADAPFFFGREDEAAEILDRIARTPIVTLAGPSGAGKTSFVHAALLPRLRLDSEVIVGRPSEVAAALRGDGTEDASLSTLVAQRIEKSNRRVTIVVDNVESLLDASGDLLSQLACVAADRADLARVILIVRENALSALETKDNASVFSEIHTLERPTAAVLKSIIERTLAAVQHRFDDASVVETMVDALAQHVSPLPLLGFAFETLWVTRDQGNSQFTRAAYEQAGGINGMITSYGESALTGATGKQFAEVREVFLRLVDANNEPRSIAKDEIGASTVVQRLIQSRLLVERDGRVEAVHAALFQHWALLRTWLDEKRSDVSFLRDVGKDAAAWKKGGEKATDTYAGARLHATQDRLTRVQEKPSEEVVRFVQAGQRRQTRSLLQRRVAMTTAWVLVGAFALFALAKTRIAYQSKADADAWRARVQADLADAQREDARSATLRLAGVIDGSELVEARAQVRASLEHEDSTLARALWGELSGNPQLWQKNVGGKPQIAFNGTRVASASGRSLHVLDAASAEDKLLRGGHEKDVSAVAFLGAETAVSADVSGKLLQWNVSTSAFSDFAEVGAPVLRLDASSDGQWLAATTREDVRVFAVASKEPRVLKGASRFAAFSSDGSIVVAPSGDKGQLTVFDTASGQAKRTLAGHPEGVTAAAVAADGSVATGGRDGDFKVWPADGGAAVSSHRHDAAINGIAQVGALWVTAGADQVLQIGDRKLSTRSPVVSIRANGAHVVVSTSDGNVQMWSTAAPIAKPEMRAPEFSHADVSAVAFDDKAAHFIAAGEDGQLAIWDVATARPMKTVKAHAKRVLAASVSPDGRLVATASADGNVKLSNTTTGDEVKTFAAGAGPVVKVQIVDKKTILSGHSDGRIRSWNIANGKGRISISAYSDRAIAFSPDGKSALTGGSSGPAQVWKVSSGRGGRTLYPQGGRFTTATFSPDGKTIATGDSRGKIQTWGTEKGAAAALGSHQGAIHQLAYDKSGKRLASAGADRTVMLWALEVPGEGKPLLGLAFEAKTLAFSPDGKSLVVGGDDGSVAVFDVLTRESIWRAPVLIKDGPQVLTHAGWQSFGTAKPAGGEAWRKAAQVAQRLGSQSPDGHLLCFVSGDSLQAWDMQKDALVATAPVNAVDDVSAFDNGCVWRAGNIAMIATVDGQSNNLSAAASAIGVEGDQVILVEEANVQTFGRDGRRASSQAFTAGATAVARGDGITVLGFDGGVLEAHVGGRTVPFASGPSARIVRIIAGPSRTFAAADANGFVGVWDGGTGRLLKQAQLNARLSQLAVSDGTLYAVNERGGITSFDLATFAADYCDVLRDVWQRTPVLWAGGRPVPTSAPSDHRCKL